MSGWEEFLYDKNENFMSKFFSNPILFYLQKAPNLHSPSYQTLDTQCSNADTHGHGQPLGSFSKASSLHNQICYLELSNLLNP